MLAVHITRRRPLALARNLIAKVRDIERSDVTSFKGLAHALEACGVPTPRGSMPRRARLRAMAA